MKIYIPAIFILFGHLTFGQIVSTINGGVWSDTTTWIGNIIPADSDDVVLNGPIIINEKAFCHDLLIGKNAALADSQTIENFDLVITGSLINEGEISSKSDQLNFLIYNDLYNKGNWDEQSNISITFSVLADHNIANDSSNIISVDNIILSGSGRKLTLLTNINLKQTTFTLDNDTLIINNNVLDNPSGVFYSPVIKSNGGTLNNANLWGSKVYGRLNVSGKTFISGGNFYDTLIVVDTLTQSLGGQSWFTIASLINNGVIRCSQTGFFTINISNIINNGILEDGNSGGLLLPQIFESLHNNGIWNCKNTNFNSSNNLKLSQSEGKFIGSDYIQVGSQLDTIFLLSDFDINSMMMGHNNIIFVGNHILGNQNKYYWGFNFKSNNGTLKNTYIINSNFEGNITFDGATFLSGNIFFSDTVRIKSIFKSYGSFITTLYFNTLINEGDIYNDGDGIYLEISKGLINASTLRCNRITFNGNEDQKITMFNSIKGNTNFVSNIVGGEYQWFLNNQPLSGKTNPILYFDSLTINQAGVYKCRVISNADTTFSQTIEVDYLTSIDEDINPLVIHNYHLCQNFPNPFNGSTSIRFNIPVDGFVTLKIYDILGKEVITLINNIIKAGSHNIIFNSSELVSGIYFYELKTNGYKEIKKMLLLK